jgi:exodeoxyribonuclease III
MSNMSWKIATFNVNGIRARLEITIDWIKQHQPHVLCLQETKCQDQDFPVEAFRKLNYDVHIKGQKSYNGVAVLCAENVDQSIDRFDDGQDEHEARFLAVNTAGIWVVNTYVPQGRDPNGPAFQSKLHFLSRIKRWLEKHANPGQPVVWTGDINVAPGERDVFDPQRLDGHVGYHPAEREALAKVLAWGLADMFRQVNPDKRQFSFWDYRLPKSVERNLGWRLDHIFATRALSGACLDCQVDIIPRLQPRPSDHTPVWAGFDLTRLS